MIDGRLIFNRLLTRILKICRSMLKSYSTRPRQSVYTRSSSNLELVGVHLYTYVDLRELVRANITSDRNTTQEVKQH